MHGWAEWSDMLFPWAIVAAGVILLAWQVRAWAVLSRKTTSSDVEFHRRRFYRRAQISFLMIVLGLLLWAGRLMFSDTEHPFWAIGYWLAAGLLTVWLLILATGDLLVGFYHFNQLKHRSDLEQIRLSLLADKLQRIHGNGKHLRERGAGISAQNTGEAGASDRAS
ncbi:hypothetical protein [Thermogutta sp.]|jgi:hypothetical protein|uniref:hypothetical protein n=1 Tax=Thermogutta sp. TaxID=1962930 RepID=UPI00321F8B3E